MAGLTLNKRLPVPLSSVTAADRLAEVGVPRNVAIPVPKPDTSVAIETAAAVVRIPALPVALTMPLVESDEKLGLPELSMAKRVALAVTSSNKNVVPDVAIP